MTDHGLIDLPPWYRHHNALAQRPVIEHMRMLRTGACSALSRPGGRAESDDGRLGGVRVFTYSYKTVLVL